MHKSAITNSLFLMMGALIILVPFTTITFPNVKAQNMVIIMMMMVIAHT